MRGEIVLFVAGAAFASWCSAAGLTAEARGHLNAWRWTKAAESCLAAIQDGTATPDTHLILVRALLYDKGKSEEAAKAAEAADAAFPDSAQVLAAKAAVLYRQAKFAEAEVAARKALAKSSNVAAAWLTLASVHELVSLRAKAQGLVQQAYQRDPQDTRVLMAWASDLQDDDRHIAALERVLATVDPEGDSDAVSTLRAHIADDKALAGKQVSILRSPYAAYDIKLEGLTRGPGTLRGWGLKVSFNGHKPATLLLDTGASGVLLGSAMAKKFGLASLSGESAPSRGIGETLQPGAQRTLAETMTIGGVTFENYPVRAFSRKQVAHEDGLIGADVFADFLVTLDLPRSRLSLAPLVGLSAPPDRRKAHDRVIPDGQESFERAMRLGNHLLLAVQVNGKAQGAFLVDTGASTNLIHAPFARRVTKVQKEDRVTLTGVQGKVKETFSADKAELVFAGFRQATEDLISTDMTRTNDGLGTELAGLLGMPVLSQLRITIDYYNGLMRLEKAR